MTTTGEEPVSSYYKWHVKNQTGDHCGRCRGRDGQTRSGEGWDLIGTPPLHDHCSCSLELVDRDDDMVPDGPPDETPPDQNCPQGPNSTNAPPGPAPADNTPTYPPATPPTTIPGGRTGGSPIVGAE
jgi:hypothetical protein